MKPAEKEILIQKNMRALGISRKEAEELIADDEAVDRGEKMPWDLTDEQMKNARKLANSTTRKTTKEVKRTKKENPEKQAIITCVHEALASMEGVTALTCTNVERTIDFTLNDINYTLTLTAHRK